MGRISLAIAAALVAAAVAGASPRQVVSGSPDTRPRFRSGVEMIRVAAIVEDARGRPVEGLQRGDFEVFVGGAPAAVAEFATDAMPVSLAVLVDASGSIGHSPTQALIEQQVHHLISWIEIGRDEVGLFAFDTRLSELEPFTRTPSSLARHLPGLAPFGQTAIFDAVVDASHRLARRHPDRGAVVLLTDGADTSSALDEADATRRVQAIDVPVYVIAAGEPAGRTRGRDGVAASAALSAMDRVARSTGGRLFLIGGPADASHAARTIVSELRHLYVLGLEARGRAGWQPISIRMRNRDLTVRTRHAFFAGAPDGRP